MRLQVLIEVAGCPTTCMHCWALGGDYGVMPIEDAAFVLDELAASAGGANSTTTHIRCTR